MRLLASISLQKRVLQGLWHLRTPLLRYVPSSRTSAACLASSSQVGAAVTAEPAASQSAAERTLFCTQCGTPMIKRVPEGDKVVRHCCPQCSYVLYRNPTMVVGTIVERDDGRVLLCKRGIDPCKGLWTVPAGYMELQESSAEGAVRETHEEANANVAIIAPYVHFDIPAIGQAYILFRARLLEPDTSSPGAETLEVQWVSPSEIPFDELAFSSVSLALRLYCEDLSNGQFRVHHGVVVKQPNSAPNDPSTFQLRHHIALTTTQLHSTN